MTTRTADLEQFADQNTVILTSFRRDGTPVDTPVHLAVEGGRAYFRTYATALKTRRLRRNPEVELWVASNGRSPALAALLRQKAARRTGPGIRAQVRLQSGEDSARAAGALARRYPVLHGFLIPWLHRHVYRTETVHAEVVPTGEALAQAGALGPAAADAA
jgi:PPOX class probable F420-dependent enzyme